jgi:hypothetical protein
MRGLVEALGAFIVGVGAGVGYLWTAGDLAPKAEAAPSAVAAAPATPPPAPPPAPAPAAAPAPEPAAPAAPPPETVATTTPAAPPPPAEPAEPAPPYGWLLVTGLGNDLSMHHFEKGEMKGKKVKYPVSEARGDIEVKSKSGPWAVTLGYKNVGKALSASVSVDPLAIIAVDGQPQGTTLAGLTLPSGKNVSLTFNGGPSVPEFKIVLQYKR